MVISTQKLSQIHSIQVDRWWSNCTICKLQNWWQAQSSWGSGTSKSYPFMLHSKWSFSQNWIWRLELLRTHCLSMLEGCWWFLTRFLWDNSPLGKVVKLCVLSVQDPGLLGPSRPWLLHHLLRFWLHIDLTIEMDPKFRVEIQRVLYLSTQQNWKNVLRSGMTQDPTKNTITC